MPIYEIDTVSKFSHKYIVEAKSLKDAKQIVKDNKVKDELVQDYLSENVVKAKEITKNQFNSLLKSLEKNKKVMSNAHLGEEIIYKE